MTKMNEEETYRKILDKPQTKYTLCKTGTELIKLNKIVKRLTKRKLITKRYYHIDGARQVVYVPFNFSDYLLNYLMCDVDDLDKEKEYLFYFKDYFVDGFKFKVNKLYVLDSNYWLYVGKSYLDKNRIRCFS